jgi:hypothetical protein
MATSVVTKAEDLYGQVLTCEKRPSEQPMSGLNFTNTIFGGFRQFWAKELAVFVNFGQKIWRFSSILGKRIGVFRQFWAKELAVFVNLGQKNWRFSSILGKRIGGFLDFCGNSYLNS